VETVKDKLIVYPWTYILYGEWAGPGIQKKVAVSQIAKKTFFVFAAHLPHAVMLEALPGEPRIPSGSDRSNYVMLDKSGIDYVFNKHNVFETIPWGTEEFVVDFRLQSSMERFTKEVTSLVEACDKVDPYIKDRYGIEGIGEGYVFVPLDPIDSLDFDVYSDFLFKAKGESHHVSSSEKKVSIQIDPAVLEGSAAFAKEFVTQGRCEQGVTEACGGEAVMKNMGAFMKWIGQDVQKESVNELEASGLDWKNVSKAVNQQARDWYILATERNL
jgi:hypothetical protein